MQICNRTSVSSLRRVVIETSTREKRGTLNEQVLWLASFLLLSI